jgi:DNA-binding GntR family transcriptional regulator
VPARPTRAHAPPSNDDRAAPPDRSGSLGRRNDSRERRVAYHADHEQLVDALSARETRRAVAVIDAHLVRVEANLLGAAGSG